MFWIPSGWVPYYAEWLLSFPRAPLGSVSIQSWTLACGAVILLVNDALIAVIGLALGFKQSAAVSQKTKEKATPVPERQVNGGEEKKEL